MLNLRQKPFVSYQRLASGGTRHVSFEWHFEMAVIRGNIECLDHPEV